jgi:hypothetical protein
MRTGPAPPGARFTVRFKACSPPQPKPAASVAPDRLAAGGIGGYRAIATRPASAPHGPPTSCGRCPACHGWHGRPDSTASSPGRSGSRAGQGLVHQAGGKLVSTRQRGTSAMPMPPSRRG